MPPSPLLFSAPLWMCFEIFQLVLGERYLGIKQIERGTHPRERGPGEWISFLWSGSLIVYWLWMGLLLVQPVGRAQVITMIGITVVGISIRQVCALKWVLITMTFEGTIRLGMLLSLTITAWRQM